MKEYQKKTGYKFDCDLSLKQWGKQWVSTIFFTPKGCDLLTRKYEALRSAGSAASLLSTLNWHSSLSTPPPPTHTLSLHHFKRGSTETGKNQEHGKPNLHGWSVFWSTWNEQTLMAKIQTRWEEDTLQCCLLLTAQTPVLHQEAPLKGRSSSPTWRCLRIPLWESRLGQW